MIERAGFDIVRIDSYGLTIELGTLAQRASLAFPRIAAAMAYGLERLVVADRRFYFDPRTKIFVYARRRVR